MVGAGAEVFGDAHSIQHVGGRGRFKIARRWLSSVIAEKTPKWPQSLAVTSGDFIGLVNARACQAIR